MIGKGPISHRLTCLISDLYGGVKKGGRGTFRETIPPEGVLGIRLILVGREGNHVVERSCFCKKQGYEGQYPEVLTPKLSFVCESVKEI